MQSLSEVVFQIKQDVTNKIDVWLIEYPPFNLDPNLVRVLSQDEKIRAQKYKTPRAYNEFIFSRGFLRTILGLYLATPSKDLYFTYTQFHKPFLKTSGATPLFFNVSHSRDLIAYIISSVGEVGIDIEYKQTLPDVEYVIEMLFSSEEQLHFSHCQTSEEQHDFFYDILTKCNFYKFYLYIII